MARHVRNAKLDTRTARGKLPPRREPYWTALGKGRALGYRKGAKGGTWIARLRDEETGKQQYEALGSADDTADADGVGFLSYRQAQDEAVRWFEQRTKELRGDLIEHEGPFRVRDACALYLDAYNAGRTRKGNARNADRLEPTINAHILPRLGDVEVARLSKKRVEEWLNQVATTPPRLRTKEGNAPRFRELDSSPEARRRRKSTANRTLNVLKAVLNHAHREGLVPSDDAWRLVSPFREADTARVRYLTDDEARRLVNACDPEFRPLVLAALHTGARYGELTALVREDFNPEAGTLFIERSKSGKPRHVVLTTEGAAFFRALAARAKPGQHLIRKAGDRPWNRSEQHRPMKDAVEAAGIEPVTFHELRHTYASRMVMKGAPLAVVAAQLGHADTRMAEKHYAHLCPGYVADTVRAVMGGWDAGADVATDDNVVPMARPGA